MVRRAEWIKFFVMSAVSRALSAWTDDFDDPAADLSLAAAKASE